MNKMMLAITIGLCVAVLPVVGMAQTAGASDMAGGARLLLVDETKTFASTMRVGALAGILRKTGMVDVTVMLVDVESSYGDPLAGLATAEEPYDIILIIPKGIDDGSVEQIWLVTRFFAEGSPEEVGLAALAGIIDQIFQGLAIAIDVSEDLWPAGYAALYLQQGWLR
ncbi:MAG: hypothetical protein U9N00_05875 [Candidatus Bipolaricaulota bacterium]|nr:hypothetical protein [Candidatus Bipolaricaulota bacterium]